MPTLAGWLTGEQVPEETIDQALLAMGEVLGQHGGEPGRMVQPGMGLITFSDAAYSVQRNDEPPVLDWVPERRTLVYRRPLSGMHALYYITDWPAQGNLLFASEIKALFALGVPRRLHLAALDALARYGFITAPWTAFKDIFVVPAGSILRWQRAKTIVNHATDYHLDEPQAASDDLAGRLHALLDAATTGLLPTHDQFIALSGGGSASALTTALAAQHTSAPFSIVTIGYKKYNAARVWKAAEGIAATCKRPFLAITGLDQPEFWAATISGLEAPVVDTRALALHQLLHTASVETGARVAMSSLGARILFDTLAPENDPGAEGPELPYILRRYGEALQPLNGVNTALLWSAEAARMIAQEEPWEESLHARKLARRAEGCADRRQGWYYLDLHLRLPDHAVHAAQQLAVQERMVVRSPYLHAGVIDLLTRLPANLDDGTPKRALLPLLARRSIPDDAPTERQSSLTAPARSLTRPADSELLREMLSPPALRERGIFAPEAVKRLLQRKPDASTQRALLLAFTTQLLCHLFDVELAL